MGNPLVDLAQQSGLFPDMFSPEPVQGPQAGVYPSDVQGYEPSALPSEYEALQNPQSPVTSPSQVPGVAPPQGGPVTAPSQLPGSTVGAGRSTSSSVSASGSGYSEAKKAKIDKNDAALNADLAKADAQAKASGENQIDVQQQSHDSQVVSAKGVAKATVDKINAEGMQARLLADVQDGFAQVEQQAYQEAQATSNQHKADYLAALADFRATKINPGQLWQNMGAGNQFGMLVSAFVHDFLGVKGMHTSAMDTLNKAIDRNISAQEQALKTKGEVAEGFKSLWYMQRNQSASDAEARARVRGFLLESAKQQVTANMAQYEAGLATAQGQAALSAIDKEFAKNLVDIYKHIDSNAVALREQAIKWHADKLRAANESWSNAIAAKNAETNRMRLALDKSQFDKAAAAMPNSIIYNPETNKGEWIARAGTRPETIDKIKENVINSTAFNAAVQELRDFERTLPPVLDPLKGTRLSNEQQRMYSAIQKRLAHAMVKANGERATDKDVEQYMESVPMDTYLTVGGVKKILADTQRFGLITPQAWIQQYADDVPKEFQPEGPKGQIFGGAKADATAVANGDDEKLTRDQKLRQDFLGKVDGPASTKTYKPDAAYLNDYHEEFIKRYPQMAAKEVEETQLNPGEVSGAEDGMAHLAQLAKGGDARAREELKRRADSYLNNNFPGDDQDWRGAYAALMLHTIENEERFRGEPYTKPVEPGGSPMYGEDFSAGAKKKGK